MIRAEGAPYHLVGPPDCSCVQGLFCSRHHHVRGPSSPHRCRPGRDCTDNGRTPMTDQQTPKGTEALATFLIDLSANDMAQRLHDALTVYVDAMRYPRGTESQRAAMWLEHTRRQGW